MFQKISDFFVKHLIYFIIILSALALKFPDNFKPMTNYTAIFLAFAMFGMGTTIAVEDFQHLIRHPKNIIIGSICQFTLMPLIALGLCVLFKLPQDLALGVILVGCAPGGTASNVLTHIGGGDVAFSVSMTILSTLLAPILTPLLVYALAGSWVEVSVLGMVKSVVQVILIPVLLGIGIKKVFAKQVDRLQSVFPLISSLAIALIISGIIGLNAEKIMTSGLMIFSVVLLHNCLGLFLGLMVGKALHLTEAENTAISVEVGTQNSGLSVVLATGSFPMNPLASLPGAIFSVCQNLVGSIYCTWRARKVEKLEISSQESVENLG